MRFAFCLFNYFPYGGLQRDFLKIARAALLRGHQVTVFTMRWDGPLEAGLDIVLLPMIGFTNHQRAGSFSKEVLKRTRAQAFDVCLGFNRQAGLDFYFAADPCLAVQLQLKKTWWPQLRPRYRRYLALEAAVYGLDSATQVLLLDSKQQAAIQTTYQTQSSRFHALPPGIEAPMLTAKQMVRERLGISATAIVLLSVGYDQVRKGLDRSLEAIAALPAALRADVMLFVVGHVGVKAFATQAKQLGIRANVQFLGSRDDVYAWMQAADLLLHPAYQETAGMVLVEALANGLPVLVTDNCGYAFHVKQAAAGLVVPGGEQFQQTLYHQALRDSLDVFTSGVWRANALQYVEHQDLFRMPRVVIDHLEQFVLNKRHHDKPAESKPSRRVLSPLDSHGPTLTITI